MVVGKAEGNSPLSNALIAPDITCSTAVPAKKEPAPIVVPWIRVMMFTSLKVDDDEEEGTAI